MKKQNCMLKTGEKAAILPKEQKRLKFVQKRGEKAELSATKRR